MKKSGLGKNVFVGVIGLAVIILSIVLYALNYRSVVVVTLDLVGALLMFLAIFLKSDTERQKMNVRDITIVAVMGALSALLYIFVKFPLPIFPSFLDMQISELPALITGFAYGPIPGIMVILIRFVIKLPFTGTAAVGEVTDLILGLIVVGVSATIYKYKRTFKWALIGMAISMVLATGAACVTNAFISIPFYLELYFQGSWEPLIAMCSMIPGINKDNFMTLYLLVGIVPFNLLRYSIVYLLTVILYKRLHILFERIAHGKVKKEQTQEIKQTVNNQ